MVKKLLLGLHPIQIKISFLRMKVDKVHTANFESYAGNFFGFWFYFFYTLEKLRD